MTKSIGITCSKKTAPIAALLVAELSGEREHIEFNWKDEAAVPSITHSGVTVKGAIPVARFLARALNSSESELYGCNPLQTSEIDHWIDLCVMSLSGKENDEHVERTLTEINTHLKSRTYLSGYKPNLSDAALWSTLRNCGCFLYILENKKDDFSHLVRWYKACLSVPVFQSINKTYPSTVRPSSGDSDVKANAGGCAGSGISKEQGVFVDLPGAKEGQVITRFPPEASGFLHIGHAKAALLNNHYARSFKGKLLMRFDDTNPSKEKEQFEEAILDDLKLLNIIPDLYSHTSDHFEYMLKCADKVIRDGNAYVDDTPVDVMRSQRMDGIESKNRGNSVEQNLKNFEEMKKGSEFGLKCVLRAKIDMQCPNKAMRDPVLYRCNLEPHVRTGKKYVAYPTYDFACPIVDSIENVTHALRTTEYHDRNPQFYWVLDVLGLRKPHICDFSRVNMVYTLLSKRKLHFFVNNGYVEGWDDPRMPTVRGILRRGLTVQALTEFIIAQGSSKSVVLMEWDKLWRMNLKVMDPVAPRLNAVRKDNCCVLRFSDNVKEEIKDVPKHKKNPDVGNKKCAYSNEILLDSEDAKDLSEGEEITLMDWGNSIIKKVHRVNGIVTKIDAILNLAGDFKKTKKKLTWLSNGKSLKNIECDFCEFGNLITKKKLEDGDDFESFVNKDTKQVKRFICDPALKDCKKGDFIQIQRLGYFIVDKPLSAACTTPVLFAIPDGKDKPILGCTTSEKVQPCIPAVERKKSGGSSALAIFAKVSAQGELVRKLKGEKAEKAKVTEAVQALLKLKEAYKAATGEEYNASKPPPAPASNAESSSSLSVDALELFNRTTRQGEVIRDLKAKKADKASITAEVQKLLKLKEEFKTLTGCDYNANSPPSVAAKPASNHCLTGNNQEADLFHKIAKQGEVVRDMKTKKVEKDCITAQVQILLKLKEEYKSVTGKDYSPANMPSGSLKAVEAAKKSTSSSEPPLKNVSFSGRAGELYKKICEMEAENFVPMSTGDHDKYVKNLLALKAEFKSLSGVTYKKGCQPVKVQSSKVAPAGCEIYDSLTKQGQIVRELKSKKAEKADIDSAVKILLNLKEDYKRKHNSEYKAGCPPSSVPTASAEKAGQCELYEKVTEQGLIVRELKAKKADKTQVDSAVKLLLSLKEEYKKKHSSEYKAGCPPGSTASAPVVTKPAKVDKRKTEKKEKKEVPQKGATRLGLEAKKEEDFSGWYQQVITKAEMIEYYDVSGCYIIRPWAYAMWDIVKDFVDKEIKELGVENCYFPMFVTQTALQKEEDHIDDFAPEVAWVTKSGDTELAEHLAIRPTSETVMYPSFAKWIQGHRDLPIKINQWCNVVRWEFKHPQPFLRTREFLWQEGHTAYADRESAIEEVMTILDLYRRVFEDLYAVPVIPGKKSPKEKFAGGDFTMTCEGYIEASGRAIQGATSHSLGQNFAKMFDVSFEDPDKTDGSKKYAWQNSWGITTRTIGVAVMVHGDNKGLVLPPRVASIQVIVVACGITVSMKEEDKKALMDKCESVVKSLKSKGIRADSDLRTNYSPGWKFNHWELKGVPVRFELGPRDLAKNQAVIVKRHNGEKSVISLDNVSDTVTSLLEDIHTSMFEKARKARDAAISRVDKWEDFVPALDRKHMVLVPWCNSIPCEEEIKAKSTKQADEIVDPNLPSMGAKSLCNPLKQPALKKGTKCIICGQDAVIYGLFGRSY